MTGGRDRLASRILIAGAGALGSVFGACLRRAGHPVTLLGRPAHLDAISNHGLRLDGLWGDYTVTGFDMARRIDELTGPFDAILMTVKSYDTPALADALAPLLSSAGVMISLQNGLGNAEAIAAAVGMQRTLAGRVIFGAERIGDGHVRVTVYADAVLIGASKTAEPQIHTRARLWADALAAAGIPTEYCADITAALWGKVFYNAALNPLGALLGVHYGALGEHADTRAIMDTLIDEAFHVARAEDVALPWASADGYRRVFYERLLPATFHHRSSMLQDLERGRPTEIDAINGAVWQRGAARGIVTPMNELLTRLVRARQMIRRSPQP